MCTCGQYMYFCLLAPEFWECCKLPYIRWLFVLWASHCLSARADCVRLYCSTSSANIEEGTVVCLYSATVPVPPDVGNFAVHSCVGFHGTAWGYTMYNHTNYQCRALIFVSILFTVPSLHHHCCFQENFITAKYVRICAAYTATVVHT